MMAGALFAQMKMTSAQVISFIQTSAKTFPDKDVAGYLKKVSMTERLTDDAIETCVQAGAGPHTRAALIELANKSATLPVAKPPSAEPAKPAYVGPPPPSTEEKNQLLGEVTDYARNYVKNLPNFTCTQFTRRFVDTTNAENFRLIDNVVESLSYSNGHEDYVVKTVNNSPTNKSHWELGGTTSAGEFGTDMKELFDPESRTEFEWESWTTWHGRRTHKIFYRVRQPNSHYTVVYEKTQSIVAGYKGYVYVDRDRKVIMRITREAENVPPDFPIQNIKQITEYSFQKIGESEQEFLVPNYSIITSKSGRYMTKNETQFRNYRKFGTESIIKFDVPDEIKPEQEEKPVTPPPAPPVKKKN